MTSKTYRNPYPVTRAIDLDRVIKAATEVLKSNGLDPRTEGNLDRYTHWYVDTKPLAELFDALNLPHRSES